MKKKNMFFDLDTLLLLPCYVFWKDLQGVYQGYSNYGAANLGYHNGNDIVGKSDFDIFPKNYASIYQEYDNRVITNKSPLFVAEEGELKNNSPVIFHSYKIPLYAEDKMLKGVLGFAIATSAYKEGDDIVHTEDLSFIELAKKINYQPSHDVFSRRTVLSEREKICLYYLSKGLTIKEIAQKISLSPRTVETYLQRIKNKKNCKNKADLIALFLKHYK